MQNKFVFFWGALQFKIAIDPVMRYYHYIYDIIWYGKSRTFTEHLAPSIVSQLFLFF